MTAVPKRPSRPASLAAALFLLTPVLVPAQDPPARPRSGFGEDLQVVTLSHLAFLPTNSAQTYYSVCCASSYRHPTSGFNAFFAPIDASLVPHGARLEQIDFFVRDDTAETDAEIAGYLCQTFITLDGASSTGDCGISAQTSGSPGDTVLTLTPNQDVLYQRDVGGDGTLDSVQYVLVAQFGVNATLNFSSSLRLRGARLLFRRQVSPAPPSATFGDVPTGHPFFQFVEALAGSGITAGCGSGSYCPDSPLTRGQMAVFLAKALGLHWPAPAPGP